MSINEQINLNNNSTHLCRNTWIEIEEEKRSEYNDEVDRDIRDRIRKVIERVTGRNLPLKLHASLVNFRVLEAVLINAISKREIFDLNHPEKLIVSRIGISSEMLISLNKKINELMDLEKGNKRTPEEKRKTFIYTILGSTKEYNSEKNQLEIFSITTRQAQKFNIEFKSGLNIPDFFNNNDIYKNAIEEAKKFEQQLPSLERALLESQRFKKRPRKKPIRSTSSAKKPRITKEATVTTSTIKSQNPVAFKVPILQARSVPPAFNASLLNSQIVAALKLLPSAKAQTNGLSPSASTIAPQASSLASYPPPQGLQLAPNPQQPPPVDSLQLLGLAPPPQGLQLAPNPQQPPPVDSLQLLGLAPPPQGLQLAPNPQPQSPQASVHSLDYSELYASASNTDPWEEIEEFFSSFSE